jgi:hypothetical protein
MVVLCLQLNSGVRPTSPTHVEPDTTALVFSDRSRTDVVSEATGI